MNAIPTDETEREKVRRTLLNSSLVVEAGAGTGKTSLLIDRLLTLVRTFDITDLVAITFTEKAAGELKDRLRRELEKLVTEKPNRPLDPKYLSALDDIDRARVSTIHAFASSIIRERPFEAGLEPDFQHIEESEELDLLMQSLADKMTMPDNERDSIISLFLLSGGRFSQFSELLMQLNKERDLLPYFKPVTPLETHAAWFNDMRDRVIELAENAQTYCHNPDDPGRVQILKAADLIPKGTNISFEEAYSWLISVANLSKTAGSQSNWDNPDYLRHQKEVVSELKASASEISERYKTAILEKLIIWLAGVIDHAQDKKLKNSLLTFQDQLITARQLLEQPDTAGYLQQRFSRLLIDEFQDTDPLQVEIAMRLVASKPVSGDVDDIQPEAGKICLVGDPKQSIYRFRRADHRIYTAATGQVQRFGEKVIISQNFRSAPGIIDFVNGFFSPIWETESQDGSTYEPLTADPGRIDPVPTPPVAVIQRDTENSEPNEKIGDVRKSEAEIIARIINIAINREKWQVMRRQSNGSFKPETVVLGDIAILMPRMTDIDIYADALAEAGIAYNIEKGKDLYLRQIVRDLYNCLAAVDNPADKLAVVGALRSNFIGLSDAELVEWSLATGGKMDYRTNCTGTSPDIKDATDVLRRLHLDRHKLSADLIIEKLLELTDIIPALLSDKFTAIDAGAVENVLELARRYEASHHGGLRGFRRMLLTKLDDKAKGDNIPIAGRVDYVRLMTIHAAKGLEFPMVILANLNSGGSKSEKIIPDRLDKRLEIELGGKSNGFRTSRFIEAVADEAKEKHSETVRLFYVALTRARDHLVLPCIYGKSASGYSKWLYELISGIGSFSGQPTPPYRLLSESELPDVAPEKKVDVKTTVDAEEVRHEQAVWQSERGKRLDDALEQLPRTILPSRHEYHPTDEARHPRVADIDTDTAAVGRALHSYMALTQTVTILDDKLADYVTKQERIHRETLERLVKTCLESELWHEASEGRRLWREIPFCVNVQGGMMRGAIDLMWEDSEGSLHIADWKTGQFDPDRHRQQLRDYMQSIERATGRKVKSADLFFAATGKRTSMQT